MDADLITDLPAPDPWGDWTEEFWAPEVTDMLLAVGDFLGEDFFIK